MQPRALAALVAAALLLSGVTMGLARKLLSNSRNGADAPAPPLSAWDNDRASMHPAAVIVVGGRFYLFYRANDTTVGSTGFEIGVATSDGGVTFAKHPGNPVLERGAAGQWDDDNIARLSLLYDNNQWVMWYQGRDITPGVSNAIGVATGWDLSSWTKYASNPVLAAGAAGWEDLYVLSPSVIRRQSAPTQLLMYYQGDASADGKDQIGVATGTDYYNWSRYGSNPIVAKGAAGQWDDDGVARPWVIYDDEYKLYYYGNGGVGIGLATSADGFTFSKHVGNPLIEPGASGAWDDNTIADPCVVVVNGTYYLYYAGENGDGAYKIGLATSADGETWAKHASNPVLDIE